MNKTKQSLLKEPFRGIKAYLWTAVLIVVCYALFWPLLDAASGDIHFWMFVGSLVLGIVLAVGYFRNKLTQQHIIGIILAGGLLLRIGYMLYTGYGVRGHDVGTIYGNGHLGYIYNLFTDFKLPENNGYQFYHPPLFHLISAAVVKVASFFLQGLKPEKLMEVVKIVPCFASTATLILVKRMTDYFKFGFAAVVITVSVVAFHPTFFILSASVNNDALMIFLFLAAFFYTIKWYDEPSFKNCMVIAVSIGLAMMTKLSGGTVALFTAPVFAAVFYKSIKTGLWKRLLLQFTAFAAVVFPLALWYPVRNLILFQQPIAYVFKIGEDSDLYVGAHSFVDRFLSFPLDQLLSPLYARPVKDFNLWLYTVKCSVFGEFTFSPAHNTAAQMLILTNFILILLSLAAMVYVMVRGREIRRFVRYGLFALWLIVMVPFVQFNIAYPFGCTMDFRYIVPTVFIGAAYLGLAYERLKAKGGWSYTVFSSIIIVVTLSFILSSVLFFCL